MSVIESIKSLTYTLNMYSAIIIPIIETEHGYEVLYEVRSKNIPQPLEVCFPGGHVEEGESNQEAAIRELCEELLVERSQIELLATLPTHQGATHRPIKPFVALIHDYHCTYQLEEVDHVFSIPLKWLLHHFPETYYADVVTTPAEDFPFELIPHGRHYRWGRYHRPIYFYKYDQEIIWGITAHITYTFIQLLSSKNPKID